MVDEVQRCKVLKILPCAELPVELPFAREREADAHPDVEGVLEDIPPVDRCSPLVRNQERGKHFDNTRLSGAVRAKQPEQLVIFDV